MKKPLQNKNERFLLSSKGKLISWGKEDVKNLLIKANKVKTEGLLLNQDVSLFDAESIFTHEWLSLFIENGITKEVVEQLNSRIAHIRYHHILMYSPQGPYWRRIANADQIHEPELAVAYGVAQLLAIGALEGLKLCKSKECQKYFIGSPNKKWCSKSCGSLYRVRLKRRKDRS